MAPQTINFTKPTLLDLPLPPKGERAYYHDTRVRGLILDVTSAGSKTFYIYRRVDGRPVRIRLGAFPEMTVEQARRKAEEVNGQIATGENPNIGRRESRAEMTFAELFAYYLENHSKVHKKSWRKDESQYRLYLLGLAKRKLSAIKHADIQELHAHVGQNNGLYAANRVLALVKALFNFARGPHKFMKGDNPAEGVPMFKERSRERRLFADEFPAFWEALADEPNETIRDFVFVSLMTGQRKADVLAMLWEGVELERATWFILDTKNGTSHTVPLTPAVIETLRRRKESAGGSDYVFPGKGKTGHIADPKKGWLRIVEQAGLSGLRLHDLRRTMGSWQVDLGASLVIVGKTLNHKSQKTTTIYSRLALDPVRHSMEAAATAMIQANGSRAPSPPPPGELGADARPNSNGAG